MIHYCHSKVNLIYSSQSLLCTQVNKETMAQPPVTDKDCSRLMFSNFGHNYGILKVCQNQRGHGASTNHIYQVRPSFHLRNCAICSAVCRHDVTPIKHDNSDLSRYKYIRTKATHKCNVHTVILHYYSWNGHLMFNRKNCRLSYRSFEQDYEVWHVRGVRGSESSEKCGYLKNDTDRLEKM